MAIPRYGTPLTCQELGGRPRKPFALFEKNSIFTEIICPAYRGPLGNDGRQTDRGKSNSEGERVFGGGRDWAEVGKVLGSCSVGRPPGWVMGGLHRPRGGDLGSLSCYYFGPFRGASCHVAFTDDIEMTTRVAVALRRSKRRTTLSVCGGRAGGESGHGERAIGRRGFWGDGRRDVRAFWIDNCPLFWGRGCPPPPHLRRSCHTDSVIWPRLGRWGEWLGDGRVAPSETSIRTQEQKHVTHKNKSIE